MKKITLEKLIDTYNAFAPREQRETMSLNRDVLLEYFKKDKKFIKPSFYETLEINLERLFYLYFESEGYIEIFQDGHSIKGISDLNIEKPAVIVIVETYYYLSNKYYLKFYFPTSCNPIIFDRGLYYKDDIPKYFNIYTFNNDGSLNLVKNTDETEIEIMEPYICISKKKFPNVYLGADTKNKNGKHIVMVYNP